MKKQIIFLGLICVVNLSAQTTVNLRDYYFPIEKLFTPKIYVYKNTSDLTFDYWLMQTRVIGNDTLFITKFYDSQFILREISTELITKENAIIVQYILRILDEQNQEIITHCLITNNVVYEFKAQNYPCSFGIITQSKFDIELIFTRNRRLNNTSIASFGYRDKELSCIEFKDKTIDIIVNEQTNEIEDSLESTEIHLYAKGFGRVQTKKYHANETTTKQIEKIISLEEFDLLKAGKY